MQKIFKNKIFKKENTFLSVSFFALILFLIPTYVKADVLPPGVITTCGELAVGGTYILYNSESAFDVTGPCLTITSSDVILDAWENGVYMAGDIDATGYDFTFNGGVFSGNILANRVIFESTTSFAPSIVGNVRFNGFGVNNGSNIEGDVLFHDNSYNLGANITGDAAFYEYGYNNGTNITGEVYFNDSSYNTGAITGYVHFFGASYNTGSISGDANFSTVYYNNGSDSAVGGIFTIYINSYAGSVSGTVYGSDSQPITTYNFTNATYNSGNINNATEVTFSGDSYNSGILNATNVYFGDTAYNTGTITGGADFNGSTYNTGTINGNANFSYDSVFQDGTVTGNVNFYYSAHIENGVINGDASFNNATWYNNGMDSAYGGVFYVSSSAHWGGSVGGVIYGSDFQPINEFIFSDSSYNNGTVPNATFNDSSYMVGGAISGTTTISTMGGGLSGIITAGTINNVVLNNGSYIDPPFVVPGNATFSQSSHNEGTVVGDATFLDLSADGDGIVVDQTGYANGVVGGTSYDSAGNPILTWNITSGEFNNTISGNAIFSGGSHLGTGVVTGNATFTFDIFGAAYNLNGTIGTLGQNNTVTFEDGTYNSGGTINGNVTFNGNAYNLGNINGDANVYFPSPRPIGGSISGLVRYYGYTAMYFNDLADGHGETGEWDDANNWWLDASSTIPALVVPGTEDEVHILTSIIHDNSLAASVKNIEFEDGVTNSITITTTEGATFFASSTNSGNIVGTTTFTGNLSNNNGIVTGSVTRFFNEAVTSVRKFAGAEAEGGRTDWIVIASGVAVNLSNAVYDTATNIFKALFGGSFVKNASMNGGEDIVPIITLNASTTPEYITNNTSTHTIKWTPSIDWGTSATCEYRMDGSGNDAYTTLANCTADGSNIPRPSSGTHTLYLRGTDSQGNISEKIIPIYYNNTAPVYTSCGADVLDEARTYYYLTSDVTGPCTITSTAATTTLRGNATSSISGFTVTGNIVGNGRSIALSNIIVTGTITSSGSLDGGNIIVTNATTSALVSTGGLGKHGGSVTVASSTVGAITANGAFTKNGGNITVATSTTGAITTNGGNASGNAGNAGVISIANSIGTNGSSTPITANGGNSTSCGTGGNGGSVSIVNSTYGSISNVGGSSSITGCPSSSFPPGSSGSVSTVGNGYVSPNTTPATTNTNTNTSVSLPTTYSGTVDKFVINKLKPLILKPTEKFNLFKNNNKINTGDTIIPNPLSAFKVPTTIDFIDLPVNFLSNVSKFVLDSISAKNNEKKYSKGLISYLNKNGVDVNSNQGLAKLKVRPLLINFKEWSQYTDLFEIKSNITYDSSLKSLVQVVRVPVNTYISLNSNTVKSIKYSNKTFEVNKKIDILTSDKPGRYVIQSSNIPFVMDVFEQKEAVQTKMVKKGRFMDWVKSLFK